MDESSDDPSILIDHKVEKLTGRAIPGAFFKIRGRDLFSRCQINHFTGRQFARAFQVNGIAIVIFSVENFRETGSTNRHR